MSIEVQHISKSFGSFHALKDVSLRVKSGELMALLGPSGSGKTSLLRIISGLDRPDVNPLAKVIMNNEDMISTSAGNRRVGFVFQHYALFRHMTVFDNIAFGMRMRRKKERPSKAEIKNKVEQLLHLIQLDNMGNRYPLQLSGGQRQRVALARALAIEPKVLLLDEPFSNIDYSRKVELRERLFKYVKEKKISLIISTHEIQEVMPWLDQIVVLQEGRLIQNDAPEETYRNPYNEYVARLFGEVNVFNDEEKKAFGVEKSFYFPTEIKIAENGLKAEVVESRFGGNHYWNKISANGKTLTVFSEHQLKDSVHLLFK